MLGKNLIQAASGAAGVGGLGIEDVFSTWLYTGNGSTQTITNGIDLSGEGGLVWLKPRITGGNGNSHVLVDTARGAGKALFSNLTSAEDSTSPARYVSAFSSTGFSVDEGVGYGINSTNITYASWTFRKAPGFFDVVTYTGTGVNRTIAHSLGSVPGCIIVKQTSASGQQWVIYHRGLTNPEQKFMLFTTASEGTLSTVWNNTAPTSSVFTVGTDNAVNQNGSTYVAYLFAHDEAIFGEGSDQSVVKCGNFAATTGTFVNLGWEPQWVLAKNTANSGNWFIVDNMRGAPTGTADQVLRPNLSDAENAVEIFDFNSTGFTCRFNNSGDNHIYIAIRRGPMKTPTSGTEVFDVQTWSGNSTSPRYLDVGFPADTNFFHVRNASNEWITSDRQRGNGNILLFSSTSSELSGYTGFPTFNDEQTRLKITGTNDASINRTGFNQVFFTLRRAPGFFDVVAYTGDNTFRRAITHNLAANPELVIIKCRSQAADWIVWHSGADITQPSRKTLLLNSSAAATIENYFFDGGIGVISSTQFGGFGAYTEINASGRTYIAYLFATLPGISKVGSYTGTATTQQINCGFTSGARFVLIKRTDSTGDWYVWDTARGIVSGNDPYLLLNSTAAEVTSTDYIDPYSAGFEISSTAPAAINASGGSFIYLAIA